LQWALRYPLGFASAHAALILNFQPWHVLVLLKSETVLMIKSRIEDILG
jgi:hypothetical protein